MGGLKAAKVVSGAHDATISFDRAKTPKARFVGRAGSITTALKGDVSPDKRDKLKAEFRVILDELGARDEAIEQIMANI